MGSKHWSTRESRTWSAARSGSRRWSSASTNWSNGWTKRSRMRLDAVPERRLCHTCTRPCPETIRTLEDFRKWCDEEDRWMLHELDEFLAVLEARLQEPIETETRTDG